MAGGHDVEGRSTIRYWVPLPQAGRVASRSNIRLYAQAAQELGYCGAWLGDHLTMPVGYQSQYPYGEHHVADSTSPFFEAYTTLSYVAGITRTLRLAVTVAVAGHRNPILHAKIAATLDVLSEGRLEIGLGAGWLAEEFAALGMDFAMRQAYLAESLDAMTRLWTEDVVTHSGQAWQFENAVCEPKPVQRPYPPLWLGGSVRLLRGLQRYRLGWVAPDVDAARLLSAVDEISSYDRSGTTRTPIAVKVALTRGAASRESPIQFDLQAPTEGTALLRSLDGRGVTDVRLNLVDLAPRNRLGAISEFARQLADAGIVQTSG